MFYRAIGIMSGSSLDGLDICYVEFDEIGGKWNYEIKASASVAYEQEWVEKLRNAIHFSALDYMRLHSAYGHYIGKRISAFIEANNLQHRVQLIGSHGHTTFHEPNNVMTGQIGDGAAIAAETGINVVSDLRAMDVALGGQGAPIVPIGEKLLLGNHQYFLNLGGIANISIVGNGQWAVSNEPSSNFEATIHHSPFTVHQPVAFDVCPANRVLNMLVKQMGHEYDEGGAIGATGTLRTDLLEKLNQLDYYAKPFPKSLANDFGTDVVYRIIAEYNCGIPDALATMVEHVAVQVSLAIKQANGKSSIVNRQSSIVYKKTPPILDSPFTTHDSQFTMLVTGGGAFNHFLIERLRFYLSPMNIDIVVADNILIEFKEALIMALMGVLRWREENNVLHSVTGASRSSIGGAVWIGQEA